VGAPAPDSGDLLMSPSSTVIAPFVRQRRVELAGVAGEPAAAAILRLRPRAEGAQTSVVGKLDIQTDPGGAPLGKVDLADGAMIVDYADAGPSPETQIRSWLVAGRAAGTWTGNGISSFMAAANPATSLGYADSSDVLSPSGGIFGGLAVDGSAVLIRFTLTGDANLDGAVNFEDLARLAQSYNTAEGRWSRGDFTMDGLVNFEDLAKLAQNYNSTLPPGGVAGAPIGFEADWAAAVAQAPEPSSVGLLIGSAVVAMARRKRHAP
jgi:hypothetical protein